MQHWVYISFCHVLSYALALMRIYHNILFTFSSSVTLTYCTISHSCIQAASIQQPLLCCAKNSASSIQTTSVDIFEPGVQNITQLSFKLSCHNFLLLTVNFTSEDAKCKITSFFYNHNRLAEVDKMKAKPPLLSFHTHTHTHFFFLNFRIRT